MRACFFTVLLLCSALAAFPDSEDRLFVRPWTELEPLVRIGDGPYPIPIDTAEKSLLDNAQALISGMVYGWTFTYIPGDLSRRVTESFVLTPIAVIPRGTPRLRVLETEVDDTRLWARVAYAMDDGEILRRTAWESNTAALSTGQGKASVLAGPTARMDSLRDAIRDAIRRALDTRYVNKPREITGEVVLWDDPDVLVRAGNWMTSARVKLVVRELEPYRIF
jgi:hypothetical protein